jgi:hypothetical protein
MRRPALVPLTLALVGAAAAAVATPVDGTQGNDALAAACAREIGERYLQATEDHIAIIRQAITRTAAEDQVELTVATGEDRTLSATCKFRSGKLFDVVR